MRYREPHRKVKHFAINRQSVSFLPKREIEIKLTEEESDWVLWEERSELNKTKWAAQTEFGREEYLIRTSLNQNRHKQNRHATTHTSLKQPNWGVMERCGGLNDKQRMSCWHDIPYWGAMGPCRHWAAKTADECQFVPFGTLQTANVAHSVCLTHTFRLI